MLKGIREDHVKLKIVAEDVWKIPKEIQPNSTSEIEEEEEQGGSTMSLRDLINQLTDDEKSTLRSYYEWEETSSKKKGQVEDSSSQTFKLRDDEDVIRTVKLSRFNHQDFQNILVEFRHFYGRETTLELESEDLEMKLVKVQGYKIPQTLAPVLKTILHHHADVCSGSHPTPGLKSFALFILCKVVKRMCSTLVKDITRDLLQQWYFHLQYVKKMNFEIDFARAHLESLVRAYMGLEAKRLEEDIPAKLKQKLADLKQEIIETESRLEKCKEYGGSSEKSELMKECLNKASEWKYKKACDLLFSDPQGNLPISDVWE